MKRYAQFFEQNQQTSTKEFENTKILVKKSLSRIWQHERWKNWHSFLSKNNKRRQQNLKTQKFVSKIRQIKTGNMNKEKSAQFLEQNLQTSTTDIEDAKIRVKKSSSRIWKHKKWKNRRSFLSKTGKRR